MKWIATTEKSKWREKEVNFKAESCEDKIILTGKEFQKIKGFGGCFNELGRVAILKAKDDERKKAIKELFDQKDGCKFSFCRVPIGASDYALDWYSLNEHDNDFEMKNFSIERDKLYLLPYIKEAMGFCPDLKLFASPWSPPTWMKNPKVYNYGRIRMEEPILSAYALYFKKFVEAYREQGVNVAQIHVQNEVFADQKFPSCLWNSEQLKIFIKDYLGPLFEKSGMDTEIWLGTLNGPEDMSFGFTGIRLENYHRFIDNILFDEKARKYISGIGYQWAGRGAIARTYESWPEIQLMQTENECGDGSNSWEYAEYVFGLARHYLKNGANAYVYWNMALEPGGESTWGWKQNSMLTVIPESGEIVYNPEFYAMKHYSHFIMPGAVRLETIGHCSSMGCAFKNPNGETVLVVQNALDYDKAFTFEGGGKTFTAVLEKNSFNTFVF